MPTPFYDLIMSRLWSVAFGLCCLVSCSAPGAADRESFEWRDLLSEEVVDGWRASAFGISGNEEIAAHRIAMSMGNPFTGVTWHGDPIPDVDYEIELIARKTMGVDVFCGLTFPVNDNFCTLILGGWGGSLTGLSSVNEIDASENFTRSFQRYDIGTDYTIRLRVEEDRVRAWLQGELLLEVELGENELSVRPEVEPSLPLGIACYNTATQISSFRVREL